MQVIVPAGGSTTYLKKFKEAGAKWDGQPLSIGTPDLKADKRTRVSIYYQQQKSNTKS